MWVACARCNRGGNGNASDKCSCGWQVTANYDLGCYLGTPILGEPKKHPKLTRSQKRYKRYLSVADCFENFRAFLKYKDK